MTKPHLRWAPIEWLPPSRYPDVKDWALFFRHGDGVTVIRLLGFTVRVFK